MQNDELDDGYQHLNPKVKSMTKFTSAKQIINEC